MSDAIPVKIHYGPDATPVRFGSEDAAAFDIHASGDPHLNQSGIYEVPTGLFVEVPKGYALFLYIRSGLGRKGITLANSVGIVDADYRGEIKGMLALLTGNEDCLPKKGERFMQGIVRKVEPVELVTVNSFEELSKTGRGDGGFGSTGTR